MCKCVSFKLTIMPNLDEGSYNCRKPGHQSCGAGGGAVLRQQGHHFPRPVGGSGLSIVILEQRWSRCCGVGHWAAEWRRSRSAELCRCRSADRVAIEGQAFLADDVVLEPAVVEVDVSGVGQAVGGRRLGLATRLCRLLLPHGAF